MLHPQRCGNCNAFTGAGSENFLWAERRSRAASQQGVPRLSGGFPGDLGALFSRFGKADGDGLLAAGDFSSFATFSGAESAFLLAAHRAGNALTGGLAVLSGASLYWHTHPPLVGGGRTDVGWFPRMFFAYHVPVIKTGYENHRPE